LCFEGEPLRPLTERRAKHSPLRDVAGTLRSFAYAAALAERELPQSLAERRAEAAARLQDWATEASAAYLESFLVGAKGTPDCPADEAGGLAWCSSCTLEKALYEVTYELAKRVRWAAFPLVGVLVFVYHAVPTNGAALSAFRYRVTDLWRRSFRRRSQKDAFAWERVGKLADTWLPKPAILHPWPQQRFVVKHNQPASRGLTDR
jgi:hypothetical protein